MQALFYLGLFGTFFFTLMGVTVGVARSSMQHKLDQQKQVTEMFQNIEFAINRVVLRDHLSLADYSSKDLNYLSDVVSWSRKQMSVDPWGGDISVVRLDDDEVIGALGPGQYAQAKVSHYALISNGPDMKRQTELPTDIVSWRKLHSEGASGDDIVYTFSTRDAAQETWNKAQQIENNIKQMALRQYMARAEQFNPSNGSGGAVTDFTSCALKGQTDNRNGLDCTQFTPAVVEACHTVTTQASAVSSADQTQNEEQRLVQNDAASIADTAQQGVAMVSKVIPTTARLDNCWQYDPKMKVLPGYPTMVGSTDNSGQRPCEGSTDCTVQPDVLGVEFEAQRDPFGGLRLAYDDANPSQLKIERRATNLDGWTIVSDKLIDANSTN